MTFKRTQQGRTRQTRALSAAAPQVPAPWVQWVVLLDLPAAPLEDRQAEASAAAPPAVADRPTLETATFLHQGRAAPIVAKLIVQ